MEKLVHTSEGVLRTDTPWWLTPGQNIRLISKDHGNESYLGSFPIGSVFYIDKACAEHNRLHPTEGTLATFNLMMGGYAIVAFRRAFEPAL